MIHVVREKDIISNCPYCGTVFTQESWESKWSFEKHYKGKRCSGCKRDVFVTVNFHGSGHDSWNKPKDSTTNLENVIREVKT